MLKDYSIKSVAHVLEHKLGHTAEVISVLKRDHRCIVFLPKSQMAVLATSSEGVRMMHEERQILLALAGKTSFQLPRIEQVSEDGSIDLRRSVSGVSGFAEISARIASDFDLASQIAGDMVSVLAELHCCLRPKEVRELALPEHKWPVSGDWIRERLPSVIRDDGLLRELTQLIDRFEGLKIRNEDKVLCHGDMGLHNIAFDESDLHINGIFDFGDATFSDPNRDLRYLLLGPTEAHYEILEDCIEHYQNLSGRQISRDRVLFYNAISAVTFLAYRKGIADGTRWCGRTFEEDMSWTRLALSKLEDHQT